jgi:adenylate cyclase
MPSVADAPVINAQAVALELERILASAEFANSERLCTLLRYVVTEAVEGRSERIKATSIAIDLYGRDESFDQQTDTIVRVEAGRLRRQLDKYYQKGGANSAVKIEVPKGHYRPLFTSAPGNSKQSPPPSPEALANTPPAGNKRSAITVAVVVALLATVLLLFQYWRSASQDIGGLASGHNPNGAAMAKPFVMVMPLDTTTSSTMENRLAIGLVEALITNLSRLSGLSVMAHASMLELQQGKISAGIKSLRETYGATHILRGRLEKEGETILVSVQLIDTQSGETLWAERLSRPIGETLQLEDELAHQISVELAVQIQPDERDYLSRSRVTDPEALVLYRQALIMLIPPNDMTRIHTARSLFRRARELDPGFAGGYAGESFSHSITLLFLKALDPEDEVAQALSLAEQAIEVDPDFGMGYATLSFAQMFAGNPEASFANARHAVAIQPGDAFAQFIMGMNLVFVGRPEEAIAPLLEAIRLDPLESRTPYRNVLGIAHYAAGQYTESLNILEDNLQQGGPQGPHMNVFLAASYAQLGREEEARELLTKTMRSHPQFPVEAWLTNWLKRGDHLEETLALVRELGPHNAVRTVTSE